MNVQYLVELSDPRQELKYWHSSFNAPIYKIRLQKDFLILLIESNSILLIHEMSSHATIPYIDGSKFQFFIWYLNIMVCLTEDRTESSTPYVKQRAWPTLTYSQ
jgi:hypothetical protein